MLYAGIQPNILLFHASRVQKRNCGVDAVGLSAYFVRTIVFHFGT